MIGTFTGSGTYVDETDASVPAQPNLAAHAAPIILQGSNIAEAFLINRRALPVGQCALQTNAVVETPDDPNSVSGFMAGIIGARAPVFTCDPLQTLVATRNTLADILAGTVYPGIIRGGYTSGNRFGLTMPRMQPIERGDSERGQLLAEALQLRVLPPATQDSNTRDNDYVLSFS
jgi:hypothetical protein